MSHLSEQLSSINPQTSVGIDVEGKNPCALLVGMQIGAVAMENIAVGPQKIKNGTAL